MVTSIHGNRLSSVKVVLRVLDSPVSIKVTGEIRVVGSPSVLDLGVTLQIVSVGACVSHVYARAVVMLIADTVLKLVVAIVFENGFLHR